MKDDETEKEERERFEFFSFFFPLFHLTINLEIEQTPPPFSCSRR